MNHKILPHAALSILAIVLGAALTACGTARVFRSDIELGELDADVTIGDEDTVSETVKNIDRKRTGVRFGDDVDGGGFFQAFTEDGDLHDDDGYGAGFGATGRPKIADITDDVPLLLDYLFAFNLIYSQSDTGGADTRTYYADIELRAGLAADVIVGLRPNIGVYADFIPYGKFDGDGEDVEFNGVNIGPYIGVGYASEDIPLIADVRALFGDVSGLEFSVGVQF